MNTQMIPLSLLKLSDKFGKSLLLNNELLRIALTKPLSTSLSVSPIMNQSRKQYKDLKDATIESGLVKSYNDSRLEIVFNNNSKIYFLSGGQKDSLRGKTVERGGVLFLDEAAFISDEVFFILLPTVDVHRANVVMVSTPFAKQGFFYDYFTRAINNEKNIYYVDVNDYDTSMLLSKEKLEEYRKTIPKQKFNTEYLGLFMDSESTLFGDFISLIKPLKQPIETQTLMYVGIDWGTGVGKDSTAISVMNEKFEQVLTKSFNNIEASKQVEYIINFLKPYLSKIKKIVVEKNSIGSVYSSYLKKELIKNNYKGEFIDFITTNKSKNELVEKLQMLIDAKTLTLLPDNKQTLELSMYEASVNPKTNTVSYNAPNGYHDDTVIALMLSILASTKPVKYAISSI